MPSREEIKRIQSMLNSKLRPSPNLAVDGIMGPKTGAAMMRYEKVRSQVGGESGAHLIVAHVPSSTAEDEDAPWMSIASSQIGIREIPGQDEHESRIVEYHSTTTLSASDDETPWCSSFVNWVMTQAGYGGTNDALAASWLNWGVPSTARYGAIVVIRSLSANGNRETGSGTGNHVGFLVEATAPRLRILGGNQVGGTRVSITGYSRNAFAVRGYRWPG